MFNTKDCQWETEEQKKCVYNTTSKMTHVNPIISIIVLNVSGLNTPVIKVDVVRLDKKKQIQLNCRLSIKDTP